MKNIPVALCLLLFISSCHHKDIGIVDSSFADSLITYYSPSLLAKTSDSDLVFWEKRMDDHPENFVNGPKYAAALSSRFHLYGRIDDLLKADSLFNQTNQANSGKEPGITRTLASLAILQHRFLQADSFLKKAIATEGQTLPNTFLDFDISFERGQYEHSKNLLKALKTYSPFGYLFRRSKFEHYDGSLDSAIASMLQAAEKAGNNNYLRQSALSNAADLYMHQGKPEEAYKLYTESIKIDAADLHSIMGIGWISLVHDRNDSLAEKIFRFIHSRSHAPDALLKLEQLAEARNDSSAQIEWAHKFAGQADQPVYGLMFSKYLIELYTGILNNPAKALALAELEIINRPTPQTYAWYVWALLCNKEKEKAYSIFRNVVSGKPLEGPELYYMAKLMQSMNKDYNAQQFFKAAYKNRYDLSPAKLKDLEKNLE